MKVGIHVDDNVRVSVCSWNVTSQPRGIGATDFKLENYRIPTIHLLTLLRYSRLNQSPSFKTLELLNPELV